MSVTASSGYVCNLQSVSAEASGELCDSKTTAKGDVNRKGVNESYSDRHCFESMMNYKSGSWLS